MPAVRLLLLDVAGTILGKPGVPARLRAALARHNIDVPESAMRLAIAQAAELRVAPPATTPEFYREFNRDVLRLLGVTSTDTLARAMYDAGRGLPWVAFDDTSALRSVTIPMGIVSNWDTGLRGILRAQFPWTFDPVCVSAELGIAKPDPRLLLGAIEQAGVAPGEALFVGDSIRLDAEPAIAAGVPFVLIDRDARCASFPGVRITSLAALPSLLGRRA